MPAIRLGPDDHLDYPLFVLKRERGVPVPFLVVLELERVNHASQSDLFLMSAVLQAVGREGDDPMQPANILIERMAGDEEPEGLALVAQFVYVGPLRHLRQVRVTGAVLARSAGEQP